MQIYYDKSDLGTAIDSLKMVLTKDEYIHENED